MLAEPRYLQYPLSALNAAVDEYLSAPRPILKLIADRYCIPEKILVNAANERAAQDKPKQITQRSEKMSPVKTMKAEGFIEKRKMQKKFTVKQKKEYVNRLSEFNTIKEAAKAFDLAPITLARWKKQFGKTSKRTVDYPYDLKVFAVEATRKYGSPQVAINKEMRLRDIPVSTLYGWVKGKGLRETNNNHFVEKPETPKVTNSVNSNEVMRPLAEILHYDTIPTTKLKKGIAQMLHVLGELLSST